MKCRRPFTKRSFCDQAVLFLLISTSSFLDFVQVSVDVHTSAHACCMKHAATRRVELECLTRRHRFHPSCRTDVRLSGTIGRLVDPLIQSSVRGSATRVAL
jgi:hypothetical protein